MMSEPRDPFEDHFERDYTSGSEWWDAYADKEVNLTISGFGMRDTFDSKSRKTTPKPVMYLVELGDKPIFVNRGLHTTLREILGVGYAIGGGAAHRGVMLRMHGYRKNMNNDTVTIIECLGATPNECVGEDFANRFLESLGKRDLGLSDFLWWIAQQGEQDSAERLAELQPCDWPQIPASVLVSKFINRAKEAPEDVRRPRPA